MPTRRFFRSDVFGAARRFGAVVRATVLELCGEPFFFLTLLASLTLTVLAPAFHYHQFGEASRLARDAGFSAFLLGGATAAVFGAIRSVRREIEDGTCEAALAHAISPGRFLAAKTVGFALALGLFECSVTAVTLVMVDGAEVGGAIAARTGALSRPWGPSLALGVAVLVLPVLFASALNRFAGSRFTLTATRATLLLSLAGVCFLLARGRISLVMRHLPVFLLAAVPVLLLVFAASLFAYRFRANAAASAAGVLAAVLLPAVGNYCLADALADGGRLPAGYLFAAVAAAFPAFAALAASAFPRSRVSGDAGGSGTNGSLR